MGVQADVERGRPDLVEVLAANHVTSVVVDRRTTLRVVDAPGPDSDDACEGSARRSSPTPRGSRAPA